MQATRDVFWKRKNRTQTKRSVRLAVKTKPADEFHAVLVEAVALRETLLADAQTPAPVAGRCKLRRSQRSGGAPERCHHAHAQGGPVLLQARHALSWMRGPMTRNELRLALEGGGPRLLTRCTDTCCAQFSAGTMRTHLGRCAWQFGPTCYLVEVATRKVLLGAAWLGLLGCDARQVPADNDPSPKATTPAESQRHAPGGERDGSTDEVTGDDEMSLLESAPLAPLPPPPSTPFISNSKFPNCVHPGVVENCEDGWCRIPAGCFVYGSPETEYARARYDELQASVPLSHDFEIQQTEVTREAWLETGWEIPFIPPADTIAPCEDPTCPINRLSWFRVAQYANWLSARRGLDPCYSVACGDEPVVPGVFDFECTVEVTAPSVYECAGYRLPTSAEWEYAARAGTTTAYYSGDMTTQTEGCQPEPNLARVAWYCSNVPKDPLPTEHEVALLEPNAWGLYDVLGNAAEWVSDDFGGVGWLDPYPDPEGQVTNVIQGTMRGGPFYADQRICRIAMKLPVLRRARNAGFRLARTLGVGAPPTLNDVDAGHAQ